MSLIDEVKELVKKGYGRVIIARELGISSQKATALIRQARLDDTSLPGPNTNPLKDLAHQNRQTGKSPKKIKFPNSYTNEDKIRYYADLGYGSRKISNILGLSEYFVDSKLRKLRGKPKRITKLEQLKTKLESGLDRYDLAKDLCTTPTGLDLMIQKSEGEYSPVKTWIKKNARTGIKLSKFKEAFKISTKARALEILKENFPEHFICETNIPNDLILTPILDNSKNYEWLGGGRPNRRFKYFVSEEGNYMSIMFDDDLPDNKIKIYNLTDIHVGSKAFRGELFRKQIERIKNEPNSFATIGGDLIEGITKVSVGDPMEQYCSINEQVVEAVKTLLPIAHKIIAVEWGNHCGGRTEKAAQFDLARTMAQMLQVPYFRVRVVIDLNFRGVQKRLSLTHKYGKALKMPQIIMAVKALSSQSLYPTHCWFSGHNHESFVIPMETTELIPGKGFEIVRFHIANGGSFVRYTGTYAEQELYGHAPQDMVYFEFDENGNHLSGSVPINSL